MSRNDARLVSRVRGGDVPALAALFERHQAPLLSLCRLRLPLRSAREAEDAVSGTFVGAHRALRHSERPRSPRRRVRTLVVEARPGLGAQREAREMPCRAVREALATTTEPPSAPLRAHLRLCAGCRSFRREVAAQRVALRALLPVAPTAGLLTAWGGRAR